MHKCFHGNADINLGIIGKEYLRLVTDDLVYLILSIVFLIVFIFESSVRMNNYIRIAARV